MYSNKRRGAYFIFRVSCAGLIRGRCLFEGGAYLKAHTTKTKHFDCTSKRSQSPYCNSYREEKEGGWACRTGEVYSLHARTAEEREHFEERTE